MDDNSLRDSWTWMDEDLKLDVGSSLAMPDCIWDDLVDNGAVVRSLFPSSPLTVHLEDSDPLSLPFDQQESPDCNPAPLKRRRFLEFERDNVMDISSCLPEPLEVSNNDFLVEVCEDLQQVDPSSSCSVWYMTNEESLRSVDDAVEQSSGSWRVGCISDSDTSEVQELADCPVNPPIDVRTARPTLKHNSGLMPQTNRTVSSAVASNVVRPIHRLTPNKVVHSPGNVQSKKSWQKSPHSKEPISTLPVDSRECPISVMAYPFALVKPTGIQGDITLQDINQRINSSPKTCFEQPKSATSSPYSGKSVLALTKIYTEGKGTITIMRTKG